LEYIEAVKGYIYCSLNLSAEEFASHFGNIMKDDFDLDYDQSNISETVINSYLFVQMNTTSEDNVWEIHGKSGSGLPTVSC
jgi:hypothetical protein